MLTTKQTETLGDFINVDFSYDYSWMHKVWERYRDTPRNDMLHADEVVYMNHRRRVEYAILNESLDKTLELLYIGVEQLKKIKDENQ